ncbi:PREDICTED: uncharacterized protein LOC109235961 [Nicotiana attenuata]|uniref:uncharacterized protein LOC109235961 n=1 Tax=Nicotiana attenuata TaxID=49451 RepID=UPI0009057BEB|nr:PREDICTED: uncharacterized protein LOC109235961 [Nicotiana attenuata]
MAIFRTVTFLANVEAIGEEGWSCEAKCLDVAPNLEKSVEPPDMGSMQIDDINSTPQPKTFLQTLLLDKHLSPNTDNISSTIPTATLTDEVSLQADNDDNFIPISAHDKSRLYEPWKYSVIIKLFGRKIAHHILRNKLIDLWKPTEQLPLIDLGSVFFLIKYKKEENMMTTLHGGPEFILNHFLSVRRWEQKFIASSTQLTYSALWMRLPELPSEFYDLEILQRVGSKLGKLLKIDSCTSSTTRGRYAQICIEVPLEKPLKTHVNIGHHRQIIQYEGLNLIRMLCGRFGHAKQSSTFAVSTSMEETSAPAQIKTDGTLEGE